MWTSTEVRMAKILDGRQTVPLEEVVANVLERRGVLTKSEVLAEIKTL